jgi:hypothetical protein
MPRACSDSVDEPPDGDEIAWWSARMVLQRSIIRLLGRHRLCYPGHPDVDCPILIFGISSHALLVAKVEILSLFSLLFLFSDQ